VVTRAFVEAAAANSSSPLAVTRAFLEATAANTAAPCAVTRCYLEVICATVFLPPFRDRARSFASEMPEREAERPRGRMAPAAPVPGAALVVFPDLPGETWPIVRRAIWRTGQAVAQCSGRSTRVAFSAWPTWEWDISWDYLPDFQGAGLTASDYKALVGFFLAQIGGLATFAYRDRVFHKVVGQQIGIGDGAACYFVLAYTAGLSPFDILEPIGFLNPAAPFKLYVEGVLQAPAAYSVNTSVAHDQVLTFTVAPAPLASVTVDMEFYYAVRFKDDILDFEEFADRLWSAQKVTLQSVIG
jgi:uncharacterized protein (TIGR02217 family)